MDTIEELYYGNIQPDLLRLLGGSKKEFFNKSLNPQCKASADNRIAKI